MSDEVTLVVEATVEFGTIEAVEVFCEPKVFDDRLSKWLRFSGADDKSVSIIPEVRKCCKDAVVRLSLQHATIGIRRTVKSYGRFNLIGISKQLSKAVS